MRYFLIQFKNNGELLNMTNYSRTAASTLEVCDYLEECGYKEVTTVLTREFINEECFKAFEDGVPCSESWFK